MYIVFIIIQMLTGIVGGNLLANMAKNLSMGAKRNSIVGMIGGGIGGQVFRVMEITAGQSGGLDFDSILGSVLAGVAGGGAVMLVVGYIKKTFF